MEESDSHGDGAKKACYLAVHQRSLVVEMWTDKAADFLEYSSDLGVAANNSPPPLVANLMAEERNMTKVVMMREMHDI